MWKFSVPLFAATLLFVAGLSAQAMEITVESTEDGFRFLSAVGEIVPGDAAKLERLMFEGFAEERVIVLTSPGGALWEGVALGITFDYFGFDVLVIEECYSACFMAYAGGEYKNVLAGGKLGMHQFSGKPLAIDETQFSVGALAERLEAFGVEAEALTPAMTTLPEDIYIYSPDELARFGLIVESPPEMFAEREARSMRISVEEYQQRRSGFLASEQQDRCMSEADSSELPICMFNAMQTFGLRR